jgi:hypothetical protein
MALRFPGRPFWDYHRDGLATIGHALRWRDVLPWTAAEILHVVLNPENTLRRLQARWRKQHAAAPPLEDEGYDRPVPLRTSVRREA